MKNKLKMAKTKFQKCLLSRSRVDMRGRPLSDARHVSTAFGKRAYFRTSIQEPAVLVLDDIKRHDATIYRCRVDFNREQSRSVRYNLTVISKYTGLGSLRCPRRARRGLIKCGAAIS